ncbi:hypothetical protein QF001_003209 [Paraburkholderia youngii]
MHALSQLGIALAIVCMSVLFVPYQVAVPRKSLMC